MTCPACLTEHLSPAVRCPHCGASLAALSRAAWGGWDGADDMIEGTIIEYEATGDSVPPGSADASSDGEQSTLSRASTPSTSLVVARPALPSLPARLWRQPAVRAVAQASMGALALTLGMRLLRGALTRPRATSQLASSALPAIRQLFDARVPRRSLLTVPDNPGGEVVETFIYIRRVVRRH